MYYNRREEDLRAVKSLILEAIKIGRQRCPMMTQEELLEIVNGLHKKMAWLARMGNNAMIQQMRNVVDSYQEEINKRYRAEADAAKKEPRCARTRSR